MPCSHADKCLHEPDINSSLLVTGLATAFAGPQFHIYPYPDLVGLSYGDVFLAFPDAIVAGVTSDHKGLERSYNTSIIRSRRKVFLNPPDDYRLQQGQCQLGRGLSHLAVLLLPCGSKSKVFIEHPLKDCCLWQSG